jgi:hypothetical protein
VLGEGEVIRRLAVFLVFATLFAALLPGVASAHTVAHNTSLDAQRNPGGVIEPGTRVRISGELSSTARKCRNNSRVRLIERGAGQVDTDRTGPGGSFSFRRVVVAETTRFRVVFAGKILNSNHPHSHTCDGSSDSVRVRVG